MSFIRNQLTAAIPALARQLAAALWLISLSAAPAKAAAEAWVQRYSHVSSAIDEAQKVVTDSVGNVIVAGSTSTGITGYDFLIIKYSGAGVPLWTNRYNGPANGNDQVTAMAVDSFGNVFVTGNSDRTNGPPYNSEYATVAYLSSGLPLWTNRYSASGTGNSQPTAIVVGPNNDLVFVTGDYATVAYYADEGVPLWTNIYRASALSGVTSARAMAVDSSGNVFVTGSSQSAFVGSDYATVAYKDTGVPLWTNRYDGPGNGGDFATAVAVDGSGNVFVTGYSVGSDNSTDYVTVAYDGSGVALWTNRYNTGSYSAAAVAVDGNGNVFVTGPSYGSDGTTDYATVAYSGAGMPLWTNRYSGPGNNSDGANAVAVDGSGNVFVTGYSVGSDGSADYATVAYSNAGVPLWSNRYSELVNGLDSASAVAVEGSGNVFVTGRSAGSSGLYDYATVAYSGAGVTLWTNRYDGPGSDFATAVAVDGSGDVVVTGRSASDYATIKYSGAGVPLWTNRYDGPGNGDDGANAMAIDGSGNVFVTGQSAGSGSSSDYATVAFSGAGVPLWTNRYDGSGSLNDVANAVAVDSSGNVFVTGQSLGSGTSFDYATIKYSGAGIALWTNRYNGPGNPPIDAATALAVDGSGNVFVTGQSRGSGGSFDYATIKYSGAGVPLWTNRYNGLGNSNDIANALAVDGNGNVFVTGSSFGSGTSFDYATIKYSGAGLPLWTNRYNGPGNSNDVANAIAVDGTGNAFVTGSSAVSGGTSDFATVAYSGAGVPLSTNRYNGPANGSDGPQTKFSLAIGPDGAVYVTGWSDGDYTTGSVFDYVTIKYPPLPLIRLYYQVVGTQLRLSWTNASFSLQSAPAAQGAYINVSGATSPHNTDFSGPQRHFRLKGN